MRVGSRGGGAASAPPGIQTAILYDHLTPFVLTQLEEPDFGGRGEARHLVAGVVPAHPSIRRYSSRLQSQP